MKIYLDSLFLLNFVMNYFLIGLTAHFGAKNTKTKRLVFSGLVGAACAFYIFLPTDVIWLHIAVKLLSAVFILLTAFGFGSMKRFLRLGGLFIGFTFFFGGFFLALANLLPQDMRQIQNGIIYIDFSPLVFLISAAVCYLVIYLFKNLFGHKEASGCATAFIQIGQRKYRCIVLLDNGHNLRDVFTDLPVMVISVHHPTPLLNAAERRSVMEQDYISLTRAGFRLIPCKTVASNGLLPVRRADKAILELPKGKRIAFAASIGFTRQKLSDDFSGIVSPSILNEV